jgi:hypothetical protein
MNPQSSRKTIIAGVAALAVAVGCFLLWRHTGASVPADEVAAFLDATQGNGRVRFTVVKIDTLRQDAAGRQVAVAAKAWPVQALYTRIDTADFLQRTFQIDQDSTAEARARLADKATARDPWLTGGRPLPADPDQWVILQPSTPADASFNFQGILDAHRVGSAWSFTLASGGFEGTGPQGDARSTFASPSFVAGDAADGSSMRSLAADFQAFAARVAKARKDSELAHSAGVDARKSAFLAQIAPGRVFAGKVLEAGEQNGTALYLEITGVSPDNGVTALLRNDGGWRNARAFEGTWGADDEFRTPSLSLTSPAHQAVRNAGAILENSQNWALELNMDARGELSGQNRFFQYRFQPLPPGQVPALKGRLEEEFDQAVAATEPGALYQGSATSVASGAAEPVLLRITGRSADGKSFEASLESATHPWKRPMRGALIDNSRRSGGEPVRLRMEAKGAVEDAPPGSALGDHEDLEVGLGLREGSLVGEDASFTYRLAPAGDNDLRRLEAVRAARARRFREVVRPGIAFDGTLREDQGFITHARLEIERVDRATGAVKASVHSLARAGVFRDFTGSCDPSGGSLSLAAANRGTFGGDGSFDIPFLAGPAADTVHLELVGSSLTGRIEGDTHWTLEFPATAFLSATTESAEADSPPADGTVFPAFPKEAGAYMLARGAWSPMPKNLGHVATETVSPKSELKLPPNLIGAVNAGLGELTKDKEKKKVTYLEFDGKDPRPVSSGQAIVILFVGPEPSGKPAVELAPCEVQKDGQRRVELPGNSTTEIRFGDQRLASFVRRPSTGYILFTTTGVLAPGPYAFNADGGYELTQE